MRICSPQLGLSPAATLGGEVYDRELLRAMAGAGATIEVLLPAGALCPPVAGWTVGRLPLRRGYRWWLSNLLFVPYVGSVWRRRPFDVLRVHSLRFTGLAALRARRLYRMPVPVIAHCHHVERDRLTARIDRRVAAGVDLVITVSEFTRRQIVDQLGVAEHRIAVVPCGIGIAVRDVPAGDTPIDDRRGVERRRVVRRGADAPTHDLASTAAPAGPTAPASAPTLLHVGSLTARKRPALLIDALAMLRRELPGTRLVLAGTGPDAGELAAQARRLGVADAVRFAGAVSEREKIELLDSASVFVAPSALEGFGLAVAEAMARGVPVVAARAGALPELVGDGEAGLLVEGGDPAAFAAAIARVAKDPDLGRRLADAGRHRARRLWSWEQVARRTLELYREARCASAS